MRKTAQLAHRVRTTHAWPCWSGIRLFEGDDDTTPPADDPPADPPADPPKETDWKAMARKHEREAKANRAAAEKLTKLEAAQQSDAEKTQAALKAAEEKAASAARRAALADARTAASAMDFTDASVAVRLLDIEDLIGDDGELDGPGLEKALKQLAKDHPYLLKSATAPGGKTSAPAGGKPATPGQVTRAELNTMSPEQIVKAQEEGRLSGLLG